MASSRSAALAPGGNVIVTGVPRSGTTLVAALLEAAPNTLCLREPDDHIKWLAEAPTPGAYVARLITGYHEVRDRIRASRRVVDRRLDGDQPVTNYFPPRQTLEERRTPTFRLRPVDTRHLAGNFTLAMKHNVEYTSVLPELIASRHFTILCAIRNPIATILSWNTLTTPVALGRIPAAAYFWPEVENRLRLLPDLIDRQVAIFDMLCERYWRYRDDIRIIRYESLLEDQAIVARAVGRQPLHMLSVDDCNRSQQYDWRLARKVYRTIRERAQSIPHFFPDAQLRALVPPRGQS